MNSDIKASRNTATGTVVSGRRRVKGLLITGAGSAGSAVFRDGGAGGATLLTVDVPANAVIDMGIPCNGLLFETDVHVTISSLTSVTTFWA